jgi:F-type H+-transporting ATPase subunit delta
MRGASRASLAEARERLAAALETGADPAQLGDELFAVARVLESQSGVRRALADHSRPAAAKSGLVEALLSGKVSPAAVELVTVVATSRWSATRDQGDAIEQLAVLAIVAAADGGGRLDELEDELFRFSRVVNSYPALRTALSNPYVAPEHKRELLNSLLAEQVSAETLELVTQATIHPRGRSLVASLEQYARLAAERRERLVAEVHVAIPLTAVQRGRLAAALASAYGHDVHLNIVLDPQIIGGLSVRIGDELIDGSTASRLAGLRRRLAA